jgi:thioredoxin reductase
LQTTEGALSYRKGEFTRIKDRNANHLSEYVGRKQLKVLLNSEVREIERERVLLKTESGIQDLKNDWVFVFAGGEMPFEFLKKIGIQFQARMVQ